MKAIKVFLWVAVLVALVYSGIMLALPQYKYRVFKSDADDIIKFQKVARFDLLSILLEKAKEDGIPVAEQDIFIGVNRMEQPVVRISWSEEVDLFGLYQKTYHFKVEVESEAEE